MTEATLHRSSNSRDAMNSCDHLRDVQKEERRRVGSTTYKRTCVDGATLWVAEGYSPADAGAAWAEVRLPSGAVAFAQPHDPAATLWALPDIVPGSSAPPRRPQRAAGPVLADLSARKAVPPGALSPLLSWAAWLSGPQSAGAPAAALWGRRGPEEEWLSRALGVSVRRAVSVHEGRAGPRPCVLAVAQTRENANGNGNSNANGNDSESAFCLLFVGADGAVTDARPLLGDAHVPCDAVEGLCGRPITLRIDGAPVFAAFADVSQAQALRDAILSALAAMYGDGCDTPRIARMRARSIEFATQLRPKPTDWVAPRDAVAAVLSAAAEDNDNRSDNRRGRSARGDAADGQLRQCLTTTAARDAVAQCVIAAADTVPTDGALSYISALLRVVEALIDCPAPYSDERLAARMQQCLEALTQRCAASPDVAEQCARAALLLDATDRALRNWRPSLICGVSRCDVSSSCASLPGPGLHLAVLCHCGGQVLTDRAGRLPAARIHSVPLHCGGGGGGALSPDAADMQWLLRIAGADAAWSDERLNAWAETYAARGGECLRAGIVRAALELRDTRLFPRLGYVLDAPVPLPAARATLIVCVCALDAVSAVPAAAASAAGLVWRDVPEVESAAYALSSTGAARRRVDLMPSAYRRCVRYVDAALRYGESVTARLAPGFYVGFFVASVCAEGALALVPECNRNLPPLARAGPAAPSVEQWRWLQSLNYRRRVCGSFGFPYVSLGASGAASPPPPDDAPFEARVAFAVATLEAAVGLRIEQFYDLELIALDEDESITAVFAVAYCPPPFYDDRKNKDEAAHLSSVDNGTEPTTDVNNQGRSVAEDGGDNEDDDDNDDDDMYTTGDTDSRRSHGVPAPPTGLVPMTYKLVRILDDHHMRRYWPRVYGCLAAEADAAERQLCATTEPFTADEALRLRPANDAMRHAADLDRYALLISCFRPLTVWVETDGLTLVPRHAPRLLDATGRAAEEVVDAAVANRAAAADARGAAMRSALLELRGGAGGAWPAVLRRLREMDSAAPDGPRPPSGPPHSRGGAAAAVPLRSFDDVPAALAMASTAAATGAPRPASVYELPCTLAEFLAAPEGRAASGCEAELCARGIVDELVEVAAAGGEAAAIGRVAETMVACVEAAEDMSLAAAFAARRADAEEAALAERYAFLRRWARGAAEKELDAQTEEELDAEAEEEPDAHLFKDLEAAAAAGPLFRAGSPRAVRRAADGVRLCVARAACDSDRILALMRSANSALHALELAQCVRAHVAAAASALPHAHIARPYFDSVAAPAVTLVSREGREAHVASLDPFRARALRTSGRVALPLYTHAELSIVAAHMNAAPGALAAQLRDLPIPADPAARRRLFGLSLELEAPLLALRLLPAVFAADPPRFSDAEASSAADALAGGFLFACDVREWLRAAALGGPAVAAGLDVLWWARWAGETAERERGTEREGWPAGERGGAYGAFAGAWPRVYAESRVRAALCAPGGAAAARAAGEAALWAEALGALVEFVSLRGGAGVGDAEVALLAETCPGVRSLDLSGTGVGDGAVRAMCERMHALVECSVAGSCVSREAAGRISEHCRANAKRESGS